MKKTIKLNENELTNIIRNVISERLCSESNRDAFEITSNMNLGIDAPGEDLNEELNEKAKSVAQQQFMGMVDAYKKGDMPDASPAIKKAAKGMTSKEVKDFAKTKHKGLPDHVDESCDGKHPYCGEKKDMENAEKNSHDNPIEFTKTQKKVKITESTLRQIIRESLKQLLSKKKL